MATNITYNGISIVNCTTREFDQELLYDQSGTDLVGVRYKIGVEGYIHSQAAASGLHGIQDGAGPVTLGAAGTRYQFDLVSQRLLVPRKVFVMQWNGATVLQATPVLSATAPPSANYDVDNGPKPRGLAVLQVTPDAIKVRWSIELTLSTCPTSPGNLLRKGPYRIINNRWSIAESRDADFFTTRRISGTIRFAEGLSPKHAFIAAVVPGLEKGFRREAIEYDVAPSGLEANYAIVDRQVHYAAPWPATNMDVVHSYSTNDGLTWLDEVQVTLRGSPEADRRMLLSRMLQIVDARCEGLRLVQENDKQYLLENVVITEHIGEANVVNCNITVRHMGETTRIVLGNILENKLGKPLELPAIAGVAYDRTISRVPATHGYDPHGSQRSPAFLFLLTCYYEDPCQQVKHIFGASQVAAQSESRPEKSANAYPVQVPALPLPQSTTSSYSQAQKTAAYTTARLANLYKVHRLRVTLPKGKADSKGDTAETADLAPGVAYRYLTYEAERIGAWPSVPDLSDSYTDGNIRGELQGYRLVPLPPVLSADGVKKIFSVQLQACYGLNRLPTREKISTGVLPYTSFKPGDTSFDLAQLQTKEIGP